MRHPVHIFWYFDILIIFLFADKTKIGDFEIRLLLILYYPKYRYAYFFPGATFLFQHQFIKGAAFTKSFQKL